MYICSFVMTRKVIFFVLFALLLLPSLSSAQRWRFYRNEIGIGIGPTALMGDVGGGPDEAANLYKDLDLQATRAAVEGKYLYMLAQNFGVGGNLMFGFVSANDDFTENTPRNYRNLQVRTFFTELSGQIRFYPLKEKFGHVYRLRGARVNIIQNSSVYLYTGFGATFFNPQGPYNGKWHNLRKLGTEGQGIMPGSDFYSPITPVIPFGVGFKYALSNKINFEFEYGGRKTFTDYFDDVSTLYFDNNLILQERGEVAAALADPSSGDKITWTHPGERRGDPRNDDFYFFLNASFNYKFIKGTSFKPRF